MIAHRVGVYLPFSQSWIYTQMRGLTRFRPMVLCKRTENAGYFPLGASGGEVVVAYSGLWQHLVQKLAKARGGGPFPAHAKAISRVGPAALHSHFADDACDDLELARRFGLPHVVSVYGADIWKLGGKGAWAEEYERLFAEADVFLAEGSAMKRRMVNLGCDPSKVRVHHLGVDLGKIDFALRRPGEDGEVRCLLAGRAVEKKGMIYGLEAFANVARGHDGLRLTVMTWGQSKRKQALMAELKRLAEERGVGDRVTWYGMQPYEEYLRITRASHIFLSPSVLARDGDAEGGCPVTVIELSGAGMPVIGSRHCDIPEVVLDGKTGYLAEERDVDGLTDRLEQLVRHPELWEAMGRAGREHVEREYNADVQIERLQDIYEEVIASG